MLKDNQSNPPNQNWLSSLIARIGERSHKKVESMTKTLKSLKVSESFKPKSTKLKKKRRKKRKVK